MEHAYDIKDSGLEKIELKKKSSKNENVDDLEFNEDEISTDSSEIVEKKIKSSSNDPDFDETETNASSESELISGRKIKPKDKTNLLGRKRKRAKPGIRKAPKSNSGSFTGDYLARPFATGLGAGIPIAAVSVPILLILSKRVSSTTKNINKFVNEKGVPALDNVSAAANNIKNLASTADNAIKNKVVPAIDKASAAADKLKDVVGTADDAIKKDIVPAIASLKDLSERAKMEINGLGTDARALVNEARNEINGLGVNANLLVQNLNDKVNKIGSNENITNLNLIMGYGKSLMNKADDKIFNTKGINNVNGILGNVNQISNQLNNLRNQNNNNNQLSNGVSRLERLNNAFLSEENLNKFNKVLGNIASIAEKLDNKFASAENLNLVNNTFDSIASLANKANNLLNNKNVNNINIIKSTTNEFFPKNSNNINNKAENNNLINQNSKKNIEENLNNMANNVNNFLVSTNNIVNNVNNIVVKFESLINENRRLAEFIGKILSGDPDTINMLKGMKTDIQAIVDWIDDNHSIKVRIPDPQHGKLHVKFHVPGYKDWWMGRTGFVVLSNPNITNKQAYLEQVTSMITEGLDRMEIEFDSNCPQDKKMNIDARNIYFSDTVAELFGAFVYNTNENYKNSSLLAGNLQAVKNVLNKILPIVFNSNSWITKQLINLITYLASTTYIEDDDGLGFVGIGKVGTGTFKRFTMCGGTLPANLKLSKPSDFLYNGINEASRQNITKEKIDKIAKMYDTALRVIGIKPKEGQFLFAPRLFALLTVMCFPVFEENQNAQQ